MSGGSASTAGRPASRDRDGACGFVARRARAAVRCVLRANAIDKLTTLFIYVILAMTWNALAGYARPRLGRPAGVLRPRRLFRRAARRLRRQRLSVAGRWRRSLVGAVACRCRCLMLRLRGGEFAIGMWVVAELAHLLVNLDPLVQGETGTSLIALNAYAAETRHALTYWPALAGMIASARARLFALLRSRTGAAHPGHPRQRGGRGRVVGVRVLGDQARSCSCSPRSAAALAGALWLATAHHLPAEDLFQPRSGPPT